MSQSDTIQLLDLPDEMLLAIFNKLKPVHFILSIMGVNKRLDKISCDRHFTTQMIDLSITPAIEQFCSYILPRIRHNVTWLTIDSVNVERVFSAAKYPNLTSLTLLHLEYEPVSKYFLGQSEISYILRNQIKNLDIQYVAVLRATDTVVCNDILTNCVNLVKLTFESYNPVSIYERLPTRYPSSILIELNINVLYFSDCLLLLEGCLPQLKIFRTKVKYIESTPLEVIAEIETIPLLNMKMFSLISYRTISMYTFNDSIVCLLHRMFNLEQLVLWLCVEGDRFLTGSDLNEQILSFLPRLLTFDYRISTGIRGYTSVNLEKDDIQRTFPIGQCKQFQANCSILSFPGRSRVCYIISQPYVLDRLDYINQNNFPPGIFSSVRSLTLCANNQLAFEHEFFIRVSRSFYCLERLYIIASEPQLHQDQILPPVEFPHLMMLIFYDNIHLDYVEQFLINTKTQLPSLTKLQINFQDLMTVTNVFTDARGLANCARVNYLYVNKQFPRTTAFNRYFPALYEIYECSKPMWFKT